MKLSIITINYNNLEGLKKTAESVISQTWRDFEWIIIDGGSTDGSKEFIEQLAEDLTSPVHGTSWLVEQFSMPEFSVEDLKENSSAKISTLPERQGKRHLLWCSEPDKGIYNALNKGIYFCSGEYVSCMNSGDTFFENTTLEQVFKKGYASEVLYGDWYHGEKGEIFIRNYYPHHAEFYSLYRFCPCHQAMFVKTELLRKGGFDESYKIAADYKRWIEAAIEGARFEYIDCVICNYERSGVSCTNLDVRSEEYNRIMNEIPPMIRESLERLDYYERSHHFIRLKVILKNGGIIAKVVGIFLSLIDKLLLHLDLSDTTYHYVTDEYEYYMKLWKNKVR